MSDQQPEQPSTNRHPAIQEKMRHFRYQQLPPHLAEVSKAVGDLAERMADELPADPQTTLGLQHLIYAKDCFVRARVAQVSD